MKLPRVHRVKRGSKVHCYHRRTRARLPDLHETHPDFIAAWLAEDQRTDRRKPTRAKPGSLADLIFNFRGSREFDALSKDYRRVIAAHLDAIVQTGGEFSARMVRTDHIQRNLRPLTAHQAAARLKAWRALCRWGLLNGYLSADPGAGRQAQALAKNGWP